MVEPGDDANLEGVLERCRAFGSYILAHAVLSGPEPDIFILKRDITIVEAADVGEHDVEMTVLGLIARRDAA